jgi:hypothetical protein
MKPTPHGFAQSRWPLALAAALAAGTSGCLVIPTPEFDTGQARANINRHTPKQLEPGKTTRAEVVMALGEPDAVSPDESKLAYRSEKVCGLWFIGGYGAAAGGPITRDRYLVAEFDALSVLQKAERTSTWCGSKYPNKLLNSSTNGAAFGFSNVPMDDDRPVMILRASDFAGVNGYQGKGRATRIGQPGRLLLYRTRLEFLSDAEFANSGSALTLPHDSLGEVRVEKYFLGRRLVVRTRAGEVHSFDIYGLKGEVPDKAALQTAAEFLRTTIKR